MLNCPPCWPLVAGSIRLVMKGTMRVPIGSPFHPSNRLAAQKTGAQASAASNPFTQPQQQQHHQQQQQQADNPFFTI
ncbi:uncharacterized protein PGTG_22200 [Puccinia graminis f. sp. tritici CRL 75-36-700-3]|uniref:Uncharacterized protein n=1 Tax=Puccinia graminis f. sp. tritici (strain CRL 75-36-700-3 / race SCCL) TaxID=418459 RepID=H6QTY9_PUCGT|nr:uncharacterized protein PGTG_22200 [Puccinia graminis f. sp. tritici CRL 75-36-700-3]EHS64403.1 hypothetical protein PGTG_22200 [Puccinia graminis f. sp. tritici CRL 75-36-700-3]